jgi:hypothetical protein
MDAFDGRLGPPGTVVHAVLPCRMQQWTYDTWYISEQRGYCCSDRTRGFDNAPCHLHKEQYVREDTRHEKLKTCARTVAPTVSSVFKLKQ